MRSLMRSMRSRTLWARIADPTLAVVLAALSFPPLGVPGIELGDLERTSPAWVNVALVLLQTLPLAVRKRWPVPVLVVVGAGFSCAQLMGAQTGVAGLAVLVAIYSTAVHQRVRRWATGLVGLIVYCCLAVALSAAGSPNRLVDWVTFVGVLVVPWCLGLLVRDGLDRQSEREAASAQRAVRAARAALAQDLHDVVTHHVTAMVIQADTARFAGAAESGAVDLQEDLASIANTGRAALSELRVLLDALDPATLGNASTQQQAARHPTGRDLATLVERLASSGYPVHLVVQGEPRLAPSVAATIHDVAREAITNAMKHAVGEAVTCELRLDDSAIELVVVNRAPSQAIDGAPGRGISGITERARRAGGSLRAGREGGEYRVELRLPVGTTTETDEQL
jgi:signal transduction histidine kinase